METIYLKQDFNLNLNDLTNAYIALVIELV